ncbi:MAG: SurA N-terminal domain-containing protein [bacterium]
MLKTLRKKENYKRIMWATLILIIPAFVVFYGWSSLTGKKEVAMPYAAKINRYEISLEEFQQRYNDTLVELRNTYKQDITEDVIKRMQLPDKVLDQMIGDYLINLEANRLGITVDDTELQMVIINNKAFAPGGRFDLKLYQDWLNNQGKSAAQFEKQLRQDIMQRKLQFLIEDFVKVSESDVRDAYCKQYEGIKIAYLSFTPQDFMVSAKITDSEMQKYYDQHKVEYTTPPQYRATYLTISPAELANSVKITDAEIQQYYETNQSEFYTPEQVRARHIITRLPDNPTPEQVQAAQEKISKALSRIQAGEDFAKVAREVSEDGTKEKGGDLGFFGHGDMDQNFEKVAFSIPIGKVSNIFQTQFGFHILKVEAKREARLQPMAEVKSAIIKKITEMNAENKAQQVAEDILRDSIQNPNLADLAKKYAVTISDSGFITGMEKDGLGANPEFFKTVENLALNAIGGPVKLNKDLLVVQLKEKQEAAIPVFSEVKDKIRIQLALADGATVAGIKAKEADAMIKKGLDIVEVGKQLGVKVISPEPFSFYSYIKQQKGSPAIAAAAFRLPTGQTSGLIEDKDPRTGGISGYYIIKVLGKSGIDEGKYLAEKDQVLKSLIQVRQRAAYQEWINNLMKRAKIIRNEKEMQKYYS